MYITASALRIFYIAGSLLAISAAIPRGQPGLLITKRRMSADE